MRAEADTEGIPPSTSRALRLLQVASFTSSFDRLMIAAMLTVIATDLDSSVQTVSQAAAVYFLAYGFAQVCWAMVSDRLGRVRTMRLALLLAGLGGAVSAAALSTGWLIAARGITGACMAAAIPSALVYIGDTVPVRVRQAPLTDLMLSTAVGITAATVLAGVIADFTSWRVAFALTGVTAIVLAVVMRRMTEPQLAVRPAAVASLRAVLTDRWALLVLVLALVEGFVLLGPLTFLPLTLHADGLGVTLAGLLTAAYGIAVLVFTRVVKGRSRHMSPTALIVVGGALAVLCYVVLTIDHHVFAVIVGCVLLAGGYAFMHSTLQTWATDVVPNARATAVSLFATMLFTGSAIGAAAAGPLADAGRFQVLFAVTLVGAVPLAVVAAWGRHRYARSRGQR